MTEKEEELQRSTFIEMPKQDDSYMYAATSILSFENQAGDQEMLEDKFLDQTYAVTYF